MADVPELPSEMWSMIYYRVRRTAATIVQAAARALGPRRTLTELRRRRAAMLRRIANDRIRRYLTYLEPPPPGAPFGYPERRRIGYRRVNFTTLRDRIAARLTSLGYMPAAAA